jgi:hypothetical protein
MSGLRLGLTLGLLGLAPVLVRSAEEASAEVRFSRDIRPILSNRCFKCHGSDLKKGGLDLRNRDVAVQPLKSGSVAIVPGKSAESELILRVTAEESSQRMPPKSEPLKPEEIAKLKAWIDQGAKYEEHWAYIKPIRPPLPEVGNKIWPKNGIDHFVLARLEREGLAPTPEAERASLLRRVSLDLTGLPPTIGELDAFLNDASEDAYEKAVDRLLASPHYGEHQARFWLDLGRYADTNGYEKDDRRTVWPFRDWVIHAFNRDLPFDQFTIEQIAGDLLTEESVVRGPLSVAKEKQRTTDSGQRTDPLIATGFHRNTMVNTEGGTDDEEFRVAAVVDRVNTTMEVWMGTTFACAQCHNHKYDPFSQKEYYQLFAFFNNTTDGGKSNDPILQMPTPEEAAKQKQLRGELTKFEVLPIGFEPFTSLALAKLEQGRIKGVQDRLNAVKPASTLILKELPKPRETHVHIRGNHKNLGDKVAPGVPGKLHPLGAPGSNDPGSPDASSSTNRLDLAKWLVDPDNPLVGRVLMNRLWARYFGRGFVETSEDFGIQGDLPMHPELLDWLASELVERKWSLKAMHKLIVTSATYRQSSRVTKELYERDPFNRLFARGPRLRLDAEMVRDNALAISGLLKRKVGGPSVFPYQPDGIWFNPYSGDKWVMSSGGDQYRRGLYTFWRRTAPYAAFMAFDAPSREFSCERRPRTNTPLQALATLNDKSFVDCAGALARRMMIEAKGNDKERAIHGFRLCVARTPTDAELEHLLRLYKESLAKYQQDAGAAKAMAKGSLSEPPKELDPAELAAWTVVANVLLNLDETITKG